MSIFSRSLISLAVLIGMLAAVQAKESCQDAPVVDIWDTAPLPDVQAVEEKTASSKPGPVGDRPIRYVWVIDHSGSMYADYSPMLARAQPYYVETPEFQKFVGNELATNFVDNKDSAAVVAFNEYGYIWDGSIAKRADSGSVFDDIKVDTKAKLTERLSKLPPPPYGVGVKGFPAPRPGAGDCGVPGAASNCSKMLEGLQAARTLLDAGSGEGIIWLVTDNIYEGGAGSQDLAKAEIDENRSFYTAIRDTPEYRVVVAYPMVNSGPASAWLRGTSLFVYGIYYDRDTTRHTPVEEVRRLLGDGAPGVLVSAGLTDTMKVYASTGSPSPGRPFRFKPLDQDVVRISLAADVKQLKKHRELGQEIKLQAKLKIQNLLDHRVIESVKFKVRNAKWIGYEPQSATKGTVMSAINTVCPGEFDSNAVSFNEPIGPNQSATVEVELTMPAVDYTIGSLNDLLQIAWNDQVVMGGALLAELQEVTSSLSIQPADFKGTYGAESLPEVFKNPQVRSYTAQFAAKTEKIENPGTLLALVAMVGLAGIAGLVAVGGFMLTSVNRRLIIDGVDKGAIAIPRLRSVRIERGSEEIGRASLSLGGAISLRGSRGYLARREGDGWILSKEGGSSIRVELRVSRR
jgi:hypothetical protein